MLLNISGIVREKETLVNKAGEAYGSAYSIEDYSGERYPFYIMNKKKDVAYNIQVGDSISVLLLVRAVYDKKYGKLNIQLNVAKLYREVKI